MPQKKRLKQIEKRQQMRESGEKQKSRVDKTIGTLEKPELSREELMDQLKRMKAITPTGVAIQFNLKVSAAKRLLEELRRNGIIDIVSRSHNLKVYALNTS